MKYLFSCVFIPVQIKKKRGGSKTQKKVTRAKYQAKLGGFLTCLQSTVTKLRVGHQFERFLAKSLELKLFVEDLLVQLVPQLVLFSKSLKEIFPIFPIFHSLSFH